MMKCTAHHVTLGRVICVACLLLLLKLDEQRKEGHEMLSVGLRFLLVDATDGSFNRDPGVHESVASLLASASQLDGWSLTHHY